jgi:hypothetical protein
MENPVLVVEVEAETNRWENQTWEEREWNVRL